MDSSTLTDISLAPTPGNASITVYYDGSCPICSREMAMYRQQVGAQTCAWVDASSCDDSALGPGLTRAQALARFNVRHADGRLSEGARGFAALWRALPRFAWAGRLAAFGPLPAMLDSAYAVFLWLRPFLQSTVRRGRAAIAIARPTREREDIR